MTVPYTSLDALKYMILRIEDTLDWVTDSLSDRTGEVDIETEIDALDDLKEEFRSLLGPLREAWNHYSDGREIRTKAEIEDGFSTSHLWHPDPARNTEQSHSGRLLADPGENNGTYVVHVVPPQTVTVQTFPPLKSV